MIRRRNSQENFIMRCLNSISFILPYPGPPTPLTLPYNGLMWLQSSSSTKSSIAHRTQRLLSAAILFLMFSSLRIEKNFLEQVIEVYFTYNSYIINNMDNIIKSIYLILTLPPHLLRNNYIPPQRHVLPIPWYSP